MSSTFVSIDKPEETVKPSQWRFVKKNIGKRATIYDCFYCGLQHNLVEAAGMYYCPNPRCTGPGVVWFNSKLKSHKEQNRGYSVDPTEQEQAATLYLRRLEASEQKKSTEELLKPVTVEERLDRIEKLLERLLK